jgi:hypothetical protein
MQPFERFPKKHLLGGDSVSELGQTSLLGGAWWLELSSLVRNSLTYLLGFSFGDVSAYDA